MTLAPVHVAALAALLGKGGVVRDVQKLAPHLREWRERWRGHTPLMALPESPEQTAALVCYCARHRIPMTPQGGNTGLVGGQIPAGEVLLCTGRMKRIRALDVANATLTADAGLSLAEARAATTEAGLMLPLSLASENAATLGGVLSTNAGGMEVLRYGSARALCLGLEVVTAQGVLWSSLAGLRKDNSGYDLKQLFIGAEGTLGIITGAMFRLHAAPKARHSAWCALARLEDALALLHLMRQDCGDALMRFELIPQIGIDLALANVPGNRAPLASPAPWHVLVELGDFGAPGAALPAVLDAAMQAGLITDAVLAHSLAQSAALLRLRESLSAAQKGEGEVLKHDIAVPVPALPAFIEQASAAAQSLAPGCRICAFGHIGDGNVHFDVLPPSARPQDAFGARAETLTEAVYACARSLGGTICAEHGVGIMKKTAILAQKSVVEMTLMRAVKTALDPNNLMNPRVLF